MQLQHTGGCGLYSDSYCGDVLLRSIVCVIFRWTSDADGDPGSLSDQCWETVPREAHSSVVTTPRCSIESDCYKKMSAVVVFSMG